jgi:hypothetical protein
VDRSARPSLFKRQELAILGYSSVVIIQPSGGGEEMAV